MPLYTILPRDTLTSIAAKYDGVSVNDIILANPDLENPHVIPVGLRIYIPDAYTGENPEEVARQAVNLGLYETDSADESYISYKVQSGDTFHSIALAFNEANGWELSPEDLNTFAAEIRELNYQLNNLRLNTPGELWVHDVIAVPIPESIVASGEHDLDTVEEVLDAGQNTHLSDRVDDAFNNLLAGQSIYIPNSYSISVGEIIDKILARYESAELDPEQLRELFLVVNETVLQENGYDVQAALGESVGGESDGILVPDGITIRIPTTAQLSQVAGGEVDRARDVAIQSADAPEAAEDEVVEVSAFSGADFGDTLQFVNDSDLKVKASALISALLRQSGDPQVYESQILAALLGDNYTSIQDFQDLTIEDLLTLSVGEGHEGQLSIPSREFVADTLPIPVPGASFLLSEDILLEINAEDNSLEGETTVELLSQYLYDQQIYSGLSVADISTLLGDGLDLSEGSEISIPVQSDIDAGEESIASESLSYTEEDGYELAEGVLGGPVLVEEGENQGSLGELGVAILSRMQENGEDTTNVEEEHILEALYRANEISVPQDGIDAAAQLLSVDGLIDANKMLVLPSGDAVRAVRDGVSEAINGFELGSQVKIEESFVDIWDGGSTVRVGGSDPVQIHIPGDLARYGFDEGAAASGFATDGVLSVYEMSVALLENDVYAAALSEIGIDISTPEGYVAGISALSATQKVSAVENRGTDIMYKSGDIEEGDAAGTVNTITLSENIYGILVEEPIPGVWNLVGEYDWGDITTDNTRWSDRLLSSVIESEYNEGSSSVAIKYLMINTTVNEYDTSLPMPSDASTDVPTQEALSLEANQYAYLPTQGEVDGFNINKSNAEALSELYNLDEVTFADGATGTWIPDGDPDRDGSVTAGTSYISLSEMADILILTHYPDVDKEALIMSLRDANGGYDLPDNDDAVHGFSGNFILPNPDTVATTETTEVDLSGDFVDAAHFGQTITVANETTFGDQHWLDGLVSAYLSEYRTAFEDVYPEMPLNEMYLRCQIEDLTLSSVVDGAARPSGIGPDTTTGDPQNVLGAGQQFTLPTVEQLAFGAEQAEDLAEYYGIETDLDGAALDDQGNITWEIPSQWISTGVLLEGLTQIMYYLYEDAAMEAGIAPEDYTMEAVRERVNIALSTGADGMPSESPLGDEGEFTTLSADVAGSVRLPSSGAVIEHVQMASPVFGGDPVVPGSWYQIGDALDFDGLPATSALGDIVHRVYPDYVAGSEINSLLLGYLIEMDTIQGYAVAEEEGLVPGGSVAPMASEFASGALDADQYVHLPSLERLGEFETLDSDMAKEIASFYGMPDEIIDGTQTWDVSGGEYSLHPRDIASIAYQAYYVGPDGETPVVDGLTEEHVYEAIQYNGIDPTAVGENETVPLTGVEIVFPLVSDLEKAMTSSASGDSYEIVSATTPEGLLDELIGAGEYPRTVDRRAVVELLGADIVIEPGKAITLPTDDEIAVQVETMLGFSSDGPDNVYTVSDGDTPYSVAQRFVNLYDNDAITVAGLAPIIAQSFGLISSTTPIIDEGEIRFPQNTADLLEQITVDIAPVERFLTAGDSRRVIGVTQEITTAEALGQYLQEGHTPGTVAFEGDWSADYERLGNLVLALQPENVLPGDTLSEGEADGSYTFVPGDVLVLPSQVELEVEQAKDATTPPQMVSSIDDILVASGEILDIQAGASLSLLDIAEAKAGQIFGVDEPSAEQIAQVMYYIATIHLQDTIIAELGMPSTKGGQDVPVDVAGSSLAWLGKQVANIATWGVEPTQGWFYNFGTLSAEEMAALETADGLPEDLVTAVEGSMGEGGTEASYGVGYDGSSFDFSNTDFGRALDIVPGADGVLFSEFVAQMKAAAKLGGMSNPLTSYSDSQIITAILDANGVESHEIVDFRTFTIGDLKQLVEDGTVLMPANLQSIIDVKQPLAIPGGSTTITQAMVTNYSTADGYAAARDSSSPIKPDLILGLQEAGVWDDDSTGLSQNEVALMLIDRGVYPSLVPMYNNLESVDDVMALLEVVKQVLLETNISLATLLSQDATIIVPTLAKVETVIPAELTTGTFGEIVPGELNTVLAVSADFGDRHWADAIIEEVYADDIAALVAQGTNPMPNIMALRRMITVETNKQSGTKPGSNTELVADNKIFLPDLNDKNLIVDKSTRSLSTRLAYGMNTRFVDLTEADRVWKPETEGVLVSLQSLSEVIYYELKSQGVNDIQTVYDELVARNTDLFNPEMPHQLVAVDMTQGIELPLLEELKAVEEEPAEPVNLGLPTLADSNVVVWAVPAGGVDISASELATKILEANPDERDDIDETKLIDFLQSTNAQFDSESYESDEVVKLAEGNMITLPALPALGSIRPDSAKVGTFPGADTKLGDWNYIDTEALSGQPSTYWSIDVASQLIAESYHDATATNVISLAWLIANQTGIDPTQIDLPTSPVRLPTQDEVESVDLSDPAIAADIANFIGLNIDPNAPAEAQRTYIVPDTIISTNTTLKDVAEIAMAQFYPDVIRDMPNMDRFINNIVVDGSDMVSPGNTILAPGQELVFPMSDQALAFAPDAGQGDELLTFNQPGSFLNPFA